MNRSYSHTDSFMLRFNQGDEKVFEEIFQLNYNRIVGFCTHFINDLEKARNHAQEAFIHLWLNREKIKTQNGIVSFLYTYAKSDCLDDLRHLKVKYRYENKILQVRENLIARQTLDSMDFNSLEFSELERLINDSVEKLPDKCKQIFIMSRVEGKKNQEIALELDISVKSVEANITKALKLLKIDLSEYLPVFLVQVLLLHCFTEFFLS